MLADKLLFEALRFSHVCRWACSEEVPEPVDMEGMRTSAAKSDDLVYQKVATLCYSLCTGKLSSARSV